MKAKVQQTPDEEKRHLEPPPAHQETQTKEHHTDSTRRHISHDHALRQAYPELYDAREEYRAMFEELEHEWISLRDGKIAEPFLARLEVSEPEEDGDTTTTANAMPADRAAHQPRSLLKRPWRLFKRECLLNKLNKEYVRQQVLNKTAFARAACDILEETLPGLESPFAGAFLRQYERCDFEIRQELPRKKKGT